MGSGRPGRYQFDAITTPLLVLCLVGMGWFGVKLVRTFIIAAQMPGWEETSATLEHCRSAKQVHTSGDHRRTVMHKPAVSYRYRVEGVTRRGTTFRLVSRTFRSEEDFWENMQKTVGIGSPCTHPDCPPVKAYYDPERPERVVMVKGIPLLRTLGWHAVPIVGLGFLAMGCLMAMRNPHYRSSRAERRPSRATPPGTPPALPGNSPAGHPGRIRRTR